MAGTGRYSHIVELMAKKRSKNSRSFLTLHLPMKNKPIGMGNQSDAKKMPAPKKGPSFNYLMLSLNLQFFCRRMFFPLTGMYLHTPLGRPVFYIHKEKLNVEKIVKRLWITTYIYWPPIRKMRVVT